MIDPPHITQTTAQPAAVIRFTIPRAEIQDVMGPGITEVIAAAVSQGIGPAGPVYSHHFRMDADTFDFEVGVPVTAPVTPTGRVTAGALPAAKVARTVYHGGYEGIGEAWGAFGAWLEAEGLAPAPNLWECYVAGPESSPDPANWRTELNWPLVG
ncbi:MAG: GyrI-like domain-containing protein [Ardenticatenales bacterium]|nr:GyrI-like domain-containing protein [Ardenticatenales bacterium]